MKRLLCLLIIATLAISVYAMFDDYEPSARARGMSGAVVSFSDDFSAIFYNPAGLRYAGDTFGTSYYQLFGSDFTNVSTVSGAYDTPFGSFGAGFQQLAVEYYDVDIMREQKFSLGHAVFLNKDIHSEIALGYSANAYSLSYPDSNLGSDFAFGVNAGVIAVLHQRTRFGFMVSNINRPRMGEGVGHALPQQFAVGASYIPYQGVITAVELKKNFEGDTELHAGAEVELHPMFIIRTGIRNNPASYSFGAKFTVWGIDIDYGTSTHAVLDMTHHFAVSYTF